MTSADRELADRRLLLVHAHPDDETIGTGVTMAKYVAEGAAVTLVSCTLGEEGEVLVDELGHLAAHAEDSLGSHRLQELTAAMGILGVTDYLRLGGDGRFRDSGMAYDDRGMAIARSELRSGTFWTADLLEAADELVPVIRDRRPQVLITYDQFGAYGHPDHVQAHRVAMYAAQLAAVPSYRRELGEAWSVSRVLWTAISESRMRESVRAFREAGDFETWKGFDPDGEMPPMVTSDADIDCAIEGREWVAQKMDAMRAHATQIALDGPFFAMADNFGDEAWGTEFFRLAVGTPFPQAAPGFGGQWASDVFAGLG
ncbi:MAG TPA: N-acetyl-1-D-myo-inositol-2-amino-2-deoxy-alpha-D-glucopyranoside deacetylase [Propionibacteriaceae bacterium]|nr:N-acetyl-1-D-myo-inositol-2-amino-2-deoxy-alpha-D-glucopyranoside deacetylase [Propionibacteriaceae bacterium]